jgi:hypothetical protein
MGASLEISIPLDKPTVKMRIRLTDIIGVHLIYRKTVTDWAKSQKSDLRQRFGEWGWL